MDGRPGKSGSAVLEANDFLWRDNQQMRQQLGQVMAQLAKAQSQSERDAERIASQQRQIQDLTHKNSLLTKRVADLEEKLKHKPKAQPPAFVKANRPSKTGKKPGRPKGHKAELRPRPMVIDVQCDATLPVDGSNCACCPRCMTRLNHVKHHQRLVEDIVPPKPITTCYNTISGFCPSCRRQVESRCAEQPPPADVPHAQLGLNTLATVAMLRVGCRLPLRQIVSLFAQLPGLRLSPAALVKQLKRMGKWLSRQYERLKLALRVSSVVHADETGWRTNGKNGYLWSISSPDHTLYHPDGSRGGKVIKQLLGDAFGQDGKQTLVSDFYAVYDQIECPQQKCLAHLLRELKDLCIRREEMAKHGFVRRCKRLVREMLKLKKEQPQLEASKYAHKVRLLERRLELLSRQKWEDADADRLTARLARHRLKLTTFLHRLEVEGTNNAAERSLRPMVVMRKITGGSRSSESAAALAILASIIRSAQQQHKDVLETIKSLLKAHWAGEDLPVLVDST